MQNRFYFDIDELLRLRAEHRRFSPHIPLRCTVVNTKGDAIPTVRTWYDPQQQSIVIVVEERDRRRMI